MSGFNPSPNEALEGGWCTCEAEMHDSKSKGALTGYERGLVSVLFAHKDLMISTSEVERRKPARATHGVQARDKARKWV